MEDSKLYTTQDIEKMKDTLDTYRETLTTLKIGTSLEKYVLMKNQLEGLKTQIVHFKEPTVTNLQMKEYEQKVKQLSIHIQSLNQTIENMNQDILSLINKLITVDNNEPIDTISTMVAENSLNNQTQPSKKFLEEITQTTDQPPLPTTEPTYKFLQNLAGKVPTMNNRAPFHPNNNPVQKQDEHHFNQHYFQSIHTQPSQIYNGSYKNNTAESTFHFKNAVDTQKIPVNGLETNRSTAPIANDLIKAESSSSIIQVPEITQTLSTPITEATENPEEPLMEESFTQITTLEEVDNQTGNIDLEKGIEEEPIKEKNSLFFNLFRKRH